MKLIEPTPTIFKDERRKRKSYHSTLLRSYEHIAQRVHYCDNCCKDILPGDCYEGRVYANGTHEIIVFKQHSNPSCEPPEDEEYRNVSESGLEQSVSRVA